MRIDNNFVAIVTGGSSGLGLATVEMLTARGAKVVMASRDPKVGEKAAKEAGAVFFQVDVTDE